MKAADDTQLTNKWVEELTQSLNEHPELATMMSAFRAADSIYQSTMAVMGTQPRLIAKSSDYIIVYQGDITDQFIRLSM